MRHPPNSTLVRALARSFIAGEPTAGQIAARASHTLGKEWRWLRPLAERYLEAVAGRTRPRHRDVIQFLLHDRGFARAWSKHAHELSVAQWLTDSQQMEPVAAARTCDLPHIESIGALCDWLWLDPGELDWFADLKGLGCKESRPRLQHYHYRVLFKGDGHVRLIEAPKPRLKKLQRQILTGILEKVPPHPAVHGFIKRRSIKTFTAPHTGQRVVLRMDLNDFFPTFGAARIQTLFRTLGYPESVGDLLGGICTNAAPRDLWGGQREARDLYSRPHLPQGAPTSPALANLCSYRMDCRLSGLAESIGARYTRYADDLAFSGDDNLERRIERVSTQIAAILLEEGFTVNHRKTRIMRQGVRQHLAGLVVNQHLNIRRKDFDLLKATLINCVRLGPETQNLSGHAAFRAHLEGRVGFVESINSARGKRLRDLFQRIKW
jgi:retron-type reverse transcriptase